MATNSRDALGLGERASTPTLMSDEEPATRAASVPPRAPPPRAVAAPERRTWGPWVALSVMAAIGLVVYLAGPRSVDVSPRPGEMTAGPTSIGPPVTTVPFEEVRGVAAPPRAPQSMGERTLIAAPAAHVRSELDIATLEMTEIRFAVDSAALPAVTPSLDRIAALLAAHPDVRIRVIGHTDSTGRPGHNVVLATRRAEAVRDALVLRGVAPDRIEVRAESASRPIASNDTAEGRRENRRVEVERVSR